MIPLFTPQQVRAMDARAYAAGVAEDDLMERAAGHLARAVRQVAGRTYGLRVAVACGKGNNGGDGLAAARRLAAVGAAPVVYLVEDDLRGLVAEQLRRWRSVGGRVAPDLANALAGADVAVDCLLGTGSSGAPRPPYPEVIAALNAFRGPVVACDLPSGVDASTGAVPGAAVQADVTLTLGARKRGLALWPARGHVGRELVGALGIVTAEDRPVAWAVDAAGAGALLPPPPAPSDKRSRGVVVALAGSPGMAGAAVLVARGAMAAGAGLVTVATGDPGLVTALAPEALTARVDPAEEGAYDAVVEALRGADALAVGPGLGTAAPTATLVRRLVREVELPVVLDADGVNAFRGYGDALADHAAPLLVLTPHAREFARLVGDAEVWERRAEAVPELAARWNAVLVAKGPGTVVAAADGRVWVNPTGGAALATGGTGDVLTGMITALVAQRPEPDSVAAAVHLHGLAGDIAAERAHTRSVTAVDVPAAVPEALRRIGAA